MLVITMLDSIAGAAVPEFAIGPGVCDAESAANAGADVWDDAPSLLIMARTTITPAAASTMAPITQRVLPGVLVALQPHPGRQVAASCFSDSILSVGFPSSFGKFIVRCSLCFVFVFNRNTDWKLTPICAPELQGW
jgi:hypothetical protein